MSKLNVVVVGGGYGAATARLISAKLDNQKYNLILIDARPFRIHMIAGARMSVTEDGNLENTAILPFDRLFHNGNGTFKQGQVVSIEKTEKVGGTVVLKDGERIPFHVLLLATGSSWDGPLAFPNDAEAVPALIAFSRAAFKAAKHVAIVGGGAVGLELSGEIKDTYPDKKITIVHGQSQLLNSTYPDRFRRGVERNVRARGVELVLDDFVDDIPGIGPVGGIKTRKGKTIDADLVVSTRGPKPNTDFILSSLGTDTVTGAGYVKVLKTLQLPAHPEIFALGDIIDVPEQKSAAKANSHMGIVSANILTFLNKGHGTLKEYKGSPEILVLTNGKNLGQAYLGLLWGIHLGDWFVRLIKGKTLLVPMFATSQGY